MMGSGQTMTPLDQSAQTETTWQPIPEYITFIMRAMSINYIVNLYKAQQIMGNHEPTYLPSPKTSSDTACLPLRTTFHTHDNTPALIQIFKLFLREPYHFIHSIDIQTLQQNCCSKTVLRVKSPSYSFNLQNLLTIKRKTKGFFVEKEIWYIIRNAINVFAYMQSANTVIGTMNPKIFNLDQGRYLAFDVLHMLPQNQHQKNVSLHNYYSPQKIHEIAMEPFEKERYGSPLIDLFKSEVFAFGLLILQVATCPASKPKFHRPSLKQMVWGQIVNRYEMSQQRYSDKLHELLEMMLREDVRIRPDWSYLRIWMMRNQIFIDIAPCVFWAI